MPDLFFHKEIETKVEGDEEEEEEEENAEEGEKKKDWDEE